MMRFWKYLNLLPLILANLSANAQIYDIQKQFPIDSLQEDFRIFRTTLEEAHPSLYRFIDKTSLDQKFDSLYQLLDKPLTEIEFAKNLSFLLEQIQDGHTSLIPSKAFLKHYYKEAKVFPFYLIFLDDKAYILFNGSEDNSILVGSEILSINDLSIPQLKKTLYEYIASDANIESFKNWVIDEMFGLLYYRFIDNPSLFTIKYINPNTRDIRTSTLNALPYEQIRANTLANYKNQRGYKYYLLNNKDYNRVEFLKQGSTALLTIKHFTDMYKLTFPKFLKNSFELIKIKQCENLIIDLRDNLGGALAYSQLLYSYLTENEFRLSDSLAWKLNRLSYGQYTNLAKALNQVNTQKSSKENSSETLLQVIKDSLGFNSNSTNRDFLKPKQKEKITDRFQGNVFFLINGGSYAATNLFCILAHRDKRGVFVGEETGGNYFESTAMIKGPIVLTLPHTKLMVQIPWLRFIWSVNDYTHPRRGVVPDYEVKQNIKGLIKGGDSVIEYTMSLIEKD